MMLQKHLLQSMTILDQAKYENPLMDFEWCVEVEGRPATVFQICLRVVKNEIDVAALS